MPADAKILDLRDHTVIPGLIGMHDHLFYRAPLNRDAEGRVPAPGNLATEVPFTGPRLYLACGVTTIRTADSNEPYADLNVRHQIEDGKLVGPKMDLTAPYLDRPPPCLRRDARLNWARGCSQARRVLGGRRIHVVQGVHAHHAR